MKRVSLILLCLALLLSLCACAQKPATPPATQAPASQPAVPDSSTAPETGAEPVSTEAAPQKPDDGKLQGAVFHVYSLKGPTSMGIASLLRDSKDGKTFNSYISTVCTAADEVTAALVSGKADIAMLPANAAAALFNKAAGFSVVNINTLGVLYLLENGESVQSIEDLAGKTICLTGKGTTPEFSLNYLLTAHEIQDQVKLEFKSEPAEVVTALSEDMEMLGLLPQPFVTVAQSQNTELRVALDLNEEWKAVKEDSTLVTGVTVVRDEILEQYPEQIAVFLQEAAAGVQYVNENPEEAGKLIKNMGIVNKSAIAQKAIPLCNLVSITGADMKRLLSGYLQTLFDQEPKAVGGAMPSDDFYYTGE